MWLVDTVGDSAVLAWTGCCPESLRAFPHAESCILVWRSSVVVTCHQNGFYQDLVNLGLWRAAQSPTAPALLVSRAQSARLWDCQLRASLLLSQPLGAETLPPLWGTLKALREKAAFLGRQSHTLQCHHHGGSSHQKKKPQKCKYSSFVDAWVQVSAGYPHPPGTSFHLREEIKNKVLSRKLRTLLSRELFVLLRPVCCLPLTQTAVSVCWSQPLLSWGQS